MPSLLLYLDSAWEMTVLPHPKAPGIAQVPVKPHDDFSTDYMRNVFLVFEVSLQMCLSTSAYKVVHWIVFNQDKTEKACNAFTCPAFLVANW